MSYEAPEIDVAKILRLDAESAVQELLDRVGFLHCGKNQISAARSELRDLVTAGFRSHLRCRNFAETTLLQGLQTCRTLACGRCRAIAFDGFECSCPGCSPALLGVSAGQ